MPCLLLLALGVSVKAEDDGEFYVNTYRSVGTVSPQSIRSSSMGRAGRGLADGVNSLGINPAAMGAFKGTGFDVSVGYDWLDNGQDDTGQTTFKLGGAVSLDRWQSNAGPNQAIGALLNIEGFSDGGTRGMERDQTGVLMAYGLHLMDDLLAGVSVALYDGTWKSKSGLTDPAGAALAYMDRSFTGGDFKVGGIYRFSEETTLGGTLNYSTGSWKEKGDYAAAVNAGSGDLTRYGLGAGIAHQYSDETLVLADIWFDRVKSDVPEALKEDAKSWGLSVGVEQEVIPEMMALRGGLYYDKTSYSSSGATTFFTGDSYSKGRFGITAGLGVKLYGWDFGYSLDINSGGDVKNLLDVSTEW